VNGGVALLSSRQVVVAGFGLAAVLGGTAFAVTSLGLEPVLEWVWRGLVLYLLIEINSQLKSRAR
jgi:hypothetical protein